jgi:hypothetical protein
VIVDALAAMFLLKAVVCQYTTTDSWVISAAMRQLPGSVSSITAAKYSDVTLTLPSDCLLLCAGDVTCAYMTFDDSLLQCSLFGPGTTAYDVSRLRLFIAERKTEVLSYTLSKSFTFIVCIKFVYVPFYKLVIIITIMIIMTVVLTVIMQAMVQH